MPENSKKEVNPNDYAIDIDRLVAGHSVDCVIFGFEDQHLKILLLKWRFGEFWTLPGGFIFQDEDLDNAALRVLKERTGLENVFLKQFHTFGTADRNFFQKKDDKEKWANETLSAFNDEIRDWLNNRFITTGYFAMVDIRKASPKPDEVSDTCEWVPINEIPGLVYDHNFIVEKALEQLRIQLNYLPISINLLPEEFTMQQLQKLYEEILNKKLERSNFQRKMLKLGIFKRMGKKYTGAANKAPYIYSFDKLKYDELVRKGIGFFG